MESHLTDDTTGDIVVDSADEFVFFFMIVQLAILEMLIYRFMTIMLCMFLTVCWEYGSEIFC